MFKFHRVINIPTKWLDNIYLADEHIGHVGVDLGGLFIIPKRDLTLLEINSLIGQLIEDHPALLNERLEIIHNDFDKL